MPKKTVTTVLIFGFLILLTNKIQTTWPQNSVYPLASGIFIISPKNTTYNSASVILNTSITVAVGTNLHVSQTYSLDGTPNQTLPAKTFTRDNSFLKQIIGSTKLSNLTNGTHNITVYAKYTQNNQTIGNENSTVHFTIKSPQQQIPEFSKLNLIILTILLTTTALLYRRYKPF